HGRGVRAHRLEPVATHSAQDEDGGKGQRNQNRLDRRSTERECRLHLLSPHSGFLTTGAMLGRRQRPLYAGQHIGGVTFVTGPPGSLVELRLRNSPGRTTAFEPASCRMSPRVSKRRSAPLTFSRLAATMPASARCDSRPPIPT